MQPFFHRFSELFAQLGLPSQPQEIAAFIRQHSPLPAEVAIEQAPFWTPAQAALLRESLLENADWAEAVDRLSAALRSRQPWE